MRHALRALTIGDSVTVNSGFSRGELQLAIGETGWATGGAAYATTANSKLYYSNLLKGLRLTNAESWETKYGLKPGYTFLFELFDEKTKATGGLEHHWGLLQEDGKDKPGLTEAVFSTLDASGASLTPATDPTSAPTAVIWPSITGTFLLTAYTVADFDEEEEKTSSVRTAFRSAMAFVAGQGISIDDVKITRVYAVDGHSRRHLLRTSHRNSRHLVATDGSGTSGVLVEFSIVMVDKTNAEANSIVSALTSVLTSGVHGSDSELALASSLKQRLEGSGLGARAGFSLSVKSPPVESINPGGPPSSILVANPDPEMGGGSKRNTMPMIVGIAVGCVAFAGLIVLAISKNKHAGTKTVLQPQPPQKNEALGASQQHPPAGACP